MLVSELIDATSATWDRQKLQAHLLPADVEAILNIPLCTRRQDDVWAWSGIFLVRSAYLMLMINKERATTYLESIAGRSDIAAVEKEWLAIWKLIIPSKIKVFLWHLARASIPSADVLHHHNMSTHDKCGMCGARDSWKHSLIECNLAKCIWALESEEVVEHLCCIQDTSAYDWLMSTIETLSSEDFIRVAITLWSIWYVRRKAIHEDSFQSPMTTHLFVDRYIAGLGITNTEQIANKVKVPKATRWIPPPAGSMKINVDAAISKNTNRASATTIVRDGGGQFLGASTLVVEGCVDPETMEVVAVKV
jgi:hypothetical protein